MKKITVLALFALVVLISAPLAAAEAPAVSTETPAAVVAAPTETAAPAETAALLPNALPFAPVNLSSCTDLCLTEYNSCRLDCRFQPYPGCANDCWLEYQACLAGC
jgi:hypothetical protein